MAESEKIRNIGIIAHIDAGKTTTTERILYYTGKEHKMGEVHDGNTVMDYRDDERARGITITSAATTCIWKDHTINIIDTPGHVDFTAEVERSLRVLDGAVGIFCGVGGVEAQSETVWKQADRYEIPRLAFVNKMDRVGADFSVVLSALQERLHIRPVVLTMPWGSGNEFRGVIDIIKKIAYTFDEQSEGRTIIETQIPDEWQEKAHAYYEELIDTLADFDDEIIERYSNNTLDNNFLHDALRRATLDRLITPVFAGASFKNKGVQCLLDAIVQYLPSPQDRPSVKGINPKNNAKTSRKPSPKESLCALAFKTIFTQHGDLTYIRIYSGKIEEGMQVYNPLRQKTERVNRLLSLHADQQIRCLESFPGDIVGVIGLKHTITGDTLCKKDNPIVLGPMKFPDTVIDKAIEPKATADKDRMGDVLKILSKDDPTFRYSIDEEHGQTVISGMGELHLDILCNRIEREHRVRVNVGRPRVSYRETIAQGAEANYTFQKQFGGREHYAYIEARVEPWPKDLLNIENLLCKEQVPKVFYASIEEGVRSAVTSGDLVGYPLINIKVTITGGSSHPLNSSAEAFSAAAFQAVKKACQKAGYLLLEPIMRFQIQTPIKYLGDINSNLGCRRAEISEMKPQGEIQIITGKVPIAEMFGYSNILRALTQGRGTFTMEPLEYAPVPAEVQRKSLML